MALISAHWANRGHYVSVITLSSRADDFHRLDSRVRRVPLALMIESRSLVEGVYRNLRRITILRHCMRSIAPDVVISFNAELNVITLLASLGLRVPVIVSERIHPPAHDIGLVWRLLRRATYRLADAVVVQSEATRAWARSLVPDQRIHVIPNAVSDVFSAPEETVTHGRKPVVLAVGRLVGQKGFDVLIRAFGAVAQRHPMWYLTIVGQGPDEAALKRLARDVLPPNTVSFLGNVDDLTPHYRAAGLFVLSSRFEGFPNALLEAMASGCAVVATNCPAGPSEIVRAGFDGVLVPPDDVDALAGVMDHLLGDTAARERLGAHAREVATRFGVHRVGALWDEVVARVQLV